MAATPLGEVLILQDLLLENYLVRGVLEVGYNCYQQVFVQKLTVWPSGMPDPYKRGPLVPSNNSPFL